VKVHRLKDWSQQLRRVCDATAVRLTFDARRSHCSRIADVISPLTALATLGSPFTLDLISYQTLSSRLLAPSNNSIYCSVWRQSGYILVWSLASFSAIRPKWHTAMQCTPVDCWCSHVIVYLRPERARDQMRSGADLRGWSDRCQFARLTCFNVAF